MDIRKYQEICLPEVCTHHPHGKVPSEIWPQKFAPPPPPVKICPPPLEKSARVISAHKAMHPVKPAPPPPPHHARKSAPSVSDYYIIKLYLYNYIFFEYYNNLTYLKKSMPVLL